MYLWIDVDCFECQVWSQRHPELLKSPLMIVSGTREQGIYSFDYAAKSYGITRRDTIETAKAKCPPLTVYKQPKCDDDPLDRMRDKIELSIKGFIAEEFDNRIQLQMEGLEEGYLIIGNEVDLKRYSDNKFRSENSWTENTKWIIGDDGRDEEVRSSDNDDLSRLEGGVNILAEILRRLAIDTGLIASGSIGDTKLIARLACHLNKPKGITVVNSNGLDQFFALIKILDVPGLKGRTGDKILSKWKKPDGSEMETLLDFKNYVPVEAIVSHRKPHGKKSYLVKWKDNSKEESWVSENRLLGICPQLVRDYEEEVKRALLAANEVEAILEYKKDHGFSKYLIKWKDHSKGETWETAIRTAAVCQDVLDEFIEQNPDCAPQHKRYEYKPTSQRKKKRKGRGTKRPSRKMEDRWEDSDTDMESRYIKVKDIVEMSDDDDDDESDNDSSDSDESVEWEVEQIVGVKKVKGESRQYLVRWKGYGEKHDTWESEEQLNCPDLIKKSTGEVNGNETQSSQRAPKPKTSTSRRTKRSGKKRK